MSISQLPASDLETSEALEQLRWLQNGFPIQAVETQFETIGIDSPEDLEKIKKLGFLWNKIDGWSVEWCIFTRFLTFLFSSFDWFKDLIVYV